MNNIVLIAVIFAGLGFLLILYSLLKKGVKLAGKLPVNFLAFFGVYAMLGLSGFMFNDLFTDRPILMGLLLLLISLSGGIVMTNKLYEKWEWSMDSNFGKKVLYLLGIVLTSVLAFVLVFLLCEHRGIPEKKLLKHDTVWWLASIIWSMLLPLLLVHLHQLWNAIPKIKQLIPVFEIPIGSSSPFVEPGGPTVNFQFVIPLDYQSKENVKSVVAFPLNRTLAEAFHYKLHEHNIAKRFARKIVYAEGNKKSKIYGWSFYQFKKIWWGWRTIKEYMDPDLNVGALVSKGEAIFVERVKTWDN